jgi:transposase
MASYVEGIDRGQVSLFPDRLEDFVSGDNPVRVVDTFVEALDLRELGVARARSASTGRPSYHPAILLKLYVYGYLNCIASSRRLEREAARNVELMWLTGRLAPDHKTIADFRRDNGSAIKRVCGQFILLCRRMGLLGDAVVAIDGSKFKAVKNRDRNFTPAKMQRRPAEIEVAICLYWTNSCWVCALKVHCTTGNQRRVRRWEHEHVLEAMEERLARRPELMRVR